jgi:ubiquinone/menaquinone biosynthesis C-methylase UbiE
MTIEKLTTSIESANARRYSEIAHRYAADWRGKVDQEQQQVLDKFLSLLGKGKKMILDAGCGTGKASVYFAQKGHRVVSLDLAEGMLKQTMKSSDEQGIVVEPIRGNMRSISLADSSLDGIWNVASLVHIPKEMRVEVVSEFHRVLRPEGILHIGVQNFLNSKHIKRVLQSYLWFLGYDSAGQFYTKPKSFKEIFGGRPILERIREGYAYLDDRHWFYPTKQELVALLREHDFRILDANGIFERRISLFAIKQSYETME